VPSAFCAYSNVVGYGRPPSIITTSTFFPEESEISVCDARLSLPPFPQFGGLFLQRVLNNPQLSVFDVEP
jgi:hypothetical protein